MASRREVADLEAKLFKEGARGCLVAFAGPRKIGEIDYERYADGGARLKIGLKGVRLPAGTHQVTIFVNESAVADLDVARGGSAYLRLDTASGDSVPSIELGDTAAVRAGDTVVCSGTFHRD